MSVIKNQHIFLPKKHLDYSKWAVIACDQFTSDDEYWETVKNYVSGNPTTLDLILPEIYLGPENEERIKEINKNMVAYNEKGLLVDEGPCMVLVDRSTKKHPSRLGIVMCVDLEDYSFNPQNESLIKPTEATVVSRIPPRIQLRKDAIFEFSHVILLYDDREQHIADKLYKDKDNLEELYNFNLNLNGGHVTGYKIKNVVDVIKQFNKLLDPAYVERTFNTTTPLMFAVGDGNHSLATAKEHWESVKLTLSEEEMESHPARYALIEAVNIHDKGITFNPIHRVVYNADKHFIKGLKKLYKLNHKNIDASFTTQKIFAQGKEDFFDLPTNSADAIKLVQDYIDKCLTNTIEMSVDYIHGTDELKEICEKHKNAIGLTLPTLNKTEIFEFILKNGVLPRKSFSIGEAREKRYYLEAHKIKLI